MNALPLNIFDTVGSWNQTAGTLDVVVEGSTLRANNSADEVKFSLEFTLINGADPTCVGGGCSGQGPLDQYIAVHGAVQFELATAMTGSALLVGDFQDLAISASSRAAGAVSQLSLTFKTRVVLLAGSTVTLTGLGGYCTAEPTLALTQAGPFKSTGTFSYAYGEARLFRSQALLSSSLAFFRGAARVAFLAHLTDCAAVIL